MVKDESILADDDANFVASASETGPLCEPCPNLLTPILADIINLLPDATFVIDKNWVVTHWNLAIERMTGVSGSHMIGRGNYEYALPFYGIRKPVLIDYALKHHAFIPGHYSVFEVRDGTIYAEILVENLQGQKIWLRGAASVILDVNGCVVGAIETLFDITWRKRSEATVVELNVALRELNASLEQRVSERTIALQTANADLIEARDAANAASKAKSEFLALMSHEIRTPMNAIIGFADIISNDKQLSSKSAGHIRILQRSAQALLVIINDILDLSKLESGHFEVEIIDFDIRETIDEALQLFEQSVRDKSIFLKSEYNSNLPSMVRGDPYRLRQVIVNLVANAIKFTEKGGVTISVCADDNNNLVCFSVADTGIGMTADQAAKVFEPFTQADASITRRFGGTGLGASIAKRILTLMGGNIWVESEFGKGSTFYFTAKLPKSLQGGFEDNQYPGDDLAAEFGPPRKFRVLLAEDNKTNAIAVIVNLQKHGHSVEWAKDGVACVSMYKNDTFDIVLMDIVMPEMDGIEASREIRIHDIACGRRVPIIGLTASVHQDSHARCIAAGMDNVLPKQSDYGPLLRAMEAIVP